MAPRSLDLKLEAVSSRLKGELIHPNKSSVLAKIEFSPDGRRIVAGDYPGGIIAVWDAVSGKRLTTIEAGYGYHATSICYAVAPDWQTIFAWREKRKHQRVEKDGKRMLAWSFGGEVRAWNLSDGKLIRTYKQDPPTNIRVMRLAPDGKTFYTFDELPGTYEGAPKNALSLWDVKTGSYRTLRGLSSYGDFSPDSKRLAIDAVDEEGYVHAVKLIDVAVGREKVSIPIPDKYAWVSVSGFSSDGKILFGTVRVFARPKQWNESRSGMKWWDADTGRELASFPCGKDEYWSISTQSPDGRMATALSWQGDKRQLRLFDVAEKRLLRTVLLYEKAQGQRVLASSPVFDPSGKWLAVITRSFPENVTRDVDAHDVPQPRILLIETATGEIRETIIAPQGFANAACFSPDGRTLATGGDGRVLLWDMTKMP